MSKKEEWDNAGYIAISSYRLKTLYNLGLMEWGTPSRIAKASGIRTNHISKVLKELKEIGVVECINEEARKGRVYRLTPKGKKLLPLALKLAGVKYYER